MYIKKYTFDLSRTDDCQVSNDTQEIFYAVFCCEYCGFTCIRAFPIKSLLYLKAAPPELNCPNCGMPREEKLLDVISENIVRCEHCNTTFIVGTIDRTHILFKEPTSGPTIYLTLPEKCPVCGASKEYLKRIEEVQND